MSYLNPDLYRVINGLPSYFVVFRMEAGTTENDSIEVETALWLPFMPTKGLMVIAARGDDYREIEQVYYEPGKPIDCWLEFAPEYQFENLMKAGWKESEVAA